MWCNGICILYNCHCALLNWKEMIFNVPRVSIIFNWLLCLNSKQNLGQGGPWCICISAIMMKAVEVLKVYKMNEW